MLKKDVTEKVKRKANELSDLCIKDGGAFAKSYKELYDRGEFNCGECFVISRLVDIYAAVNLAVNLMLVIPCYVLREQFGFGNKRMEKYITEFHRLYQAVVKDKVKISTLADSVEHDTGIKIADDSEIWNVRK